MNFENTFDVGAPAEAVWSTLMDVERVTPCMPGAHVVEATGENTFKVAIKVKVGPISMTYRGDVEIVERDDDSHAATMHVKARETRGQGSADAHVRMSLSEDGGQTHARLDTDVQLTGKAASMGRGVIGDVAERLVQTFAGNLAEMVTREDAAARSAAGNGRPRENAGEETPPGEETPAGEQSRAGAESPAGAGRAPVREATRPRAAAESSLPGGEIAASVIAGRLSDPRTLVIAVAAVWGAGALVGYLLGRRG